VTDQGHDPGARGGCEHRPRLARIERERLLAQDVLPRGHRFEHHRRMSEGRGGDGHGVDTGQGERLGQRRHRRDLEPRRPARRPLRVAPHERVDGEAGGP